MLLYENHEIIITFKHCLDRLLIVLICLHIIHLIIFGVFMSLLFISDSYIADLNVIDKLMLI